MKFNLTKEVKRETLVSHIVLEGMMPELAKSLEHVKGAIIADLRLTVNGHELDLRKFCDVWQSQVEGMIRDEAIKIVIED